MSTWVEDGDPADYTTAFLTYIDDYDDTNLDLYWINYDGTDLVTKVLYYVIPANHVFITTKMTDSTTVMALVNDTELKKMTLCSFDFLGDAYSCFESPDTFNIENFYLEVKWIGSDVVIGGNLDYLFSSGEERSIYGVYFGLEEATAESVSFEFDDDYVEMADGEGYDALLTQNARIGEFPTQRLDEKSTNHFRLFAYDTSVDKNLSLMIDMPPSASGVTTLPL